MSAPETPGREAPYEVGVALVRITALTDESAETGGAIPGFEQAMGRRSKRYAVTPDALTIARGEPAVREATQALAKQIGLIAGQVAETVGLEAMSASSSGKFSLDSVEVSFGVTLTAGIQTIFTAQAESSAQVTITLTRAPG